MTYTNAFNSGLAQLVEAEAIPPFVYTYPTRSAYRPLAEDWTIERIWEVDRGNSTGDLNLYIHVPFCHYKCGYCNLYTVTSRDMTLYSRYTSAVCHQLLMHAPIIQQRNLRTIYIGGGTPSLLSKEDVARIFDTISTIYPNWRVVVEEVCIEATPDSIVNDPGVVDHLMGCGVTRINMGVQSLSNAELREAGRSAANEEVVCQAFKIVKESGLPNLSTDLIIGFAGQDDQSWQRSVTRLAFLRPETISTYFLTIRPDAWFHRTGRYRYMRDPGLYRRYDVAREAFTAQGYVQESNVRYKLPGRGGYRQKVLQFRGVPYLGIGAGARTYTNTVDYLIGGGKNPNVQQVEDYIASVESGNLKPSSGFVFDDEERIRKRLVLDNFDLSLLELRRFGFDRFRERFQPVLDEAVALGLMEKAGSDRFHLTPAGFKYRDIISWHLFSDRVVELDREFYQGLQQSSPVRPGGRAPMPV